MKALVFNGPRDVRYESYADPELASANSAIIAVKACSICGSDLHIYHGDQIGSADYGADTPKFCVGHEFIGEVVEAGSNVHGYRVGDRVLAAGGTGCGNCQACKTGRAYACERSTAFGLSAQLNGGQAEFVNVPNADQTLMHIPDGLTDDQAILLTDAAATAQFGIQNADIQPGATVAIVGLGPIGLIGIELAFLAGAAQVFAIDPIAERRNRAAALGAQAFTPSADLVSEIRALTSGAGPSSVFEASGAKPAVKLATGLVATGGTVSFIGLPQPDVQLPLMALLYRNITVRAGIAPVPQLWQSLVPLFQSGRLKAEHLFTHRLRLDQGAEAYRLFDQRADGVIKIALTV